MKRNKLLTVLPLAALLLAGGVSCTNDLSEGLPDASPEGLAIAFNTGEGGFTRAEVQDNSALREDYVDHVDVFIFDGATGQIVKNGTEGNCYWRVTASQMEENQTRTQTLLDGDWKTAPLSGTDYDVYVVANLHGTGNLSSVTTVDDLKKVVETDEEVYRVYNSSTYADKLFTMTGKVENWNPQSVQEDEYILPVTLTRVAAKIEISLQLTEEFKQKYQPTSFMQQLRNYAASALLIEGSDDTFAYEQASSTENPAWTFNTTEGTATLVLYTYPTEWNADVMKETYVIANIPVVNQDPQEGEESNISRNYYKIPLRAVADNKVLERNHIYRVKATVDMLGTYTPDTPVELKTVKYEVATWVDETVNISGDNPKYLMLGLETIIMKNVDTNSEQTFTSSSFLAPYENVSNYAVELLTDSRYTYTYDKYGQPTALSQNLLNSIQADIEFDKNSLSGKITINSPVPTNNGVRYMTFRVTNSQGSEAYFLVKQYPLEYITSTQGVRGYRQDASYSDNIYRALRVGKTNPNGTSTIQYTNHNGTANYGDESTLNNARMYHIMITSTGGILVDNDWGDDEYYTLANPLTDGNGYTIPTEENTNLVAPSFMIASQLGASYPMSYANAQRQCNQYREVTKVVQPDGSTKEVTYSGWRLPTLAELKIINKFQGVTGSAMDKVLTGHEYWFAYETTSYYQTWHYTYDPEDGNYKQNNRGNVRCVRTAPELMAD